MTYLFALAADDQIGVAAIGFLVLIWVIVMTQEMSR